MKKVLVISGHPDIKSSQANSMIIDNLEKHSNVKVRNLIEAYPDFKISIDNEIKALVEADVVILQFPFHWYNVPAILKQWIDAIVTPLVYGKHKGALQNKTLIISTTTGGPEVSYSKEGYNKYTMKQFLLPLIKLGDSLGMKVQDLVITHSCSNSDPSLKERLNLHSNRLITNFHSE